MTTDAANNAQEEERKDKTPKDRAAFWHVQLHLSEAQEKDWRSDGSAVVGRYKNEADSVSKRQSRRFNILFSNTETLKAALYGKTAKPDVRRRFADKDPIAREAAEVIERGLIYCAEVYDVDKCIERAIHEYLLPGRGVVRLEYEPVFKSAPAMDAMGQPIEGEEQEFIAEQKLREKHVYWEDFLHSPARAWDDVWWVAFRHLMSREDLRENDFKDPDDIPLNWEPKVDKKETPESLKKAEVWEIWDKSRRERVWIVKGYPKTLKVDDDPYGLESFFPLPEPLVSYGDTQTLVPTPEFKAYQAQADDLDEITARISRLTRGLKRRGVYNQAIKELKRLANANDNEFIAVEKWSELLSKGGLEAQFQTEDISQFAVVLKELYVQRDQLVQGIYELTGIADIMRGSSDPNETLGAQQLKAQFGSNRLKRRQRAVQKWIRDLYKLKAEILAEHFEPNILQEMTGIQVSPELIQLLRSDKLRSYRIDIETDSTVFEDAEAVKQQTVEVLTAVGSFLQQAVPAAQTAPEMAPLLFEMLSVGVRHFKRGRELEDIIEQTKEAVMQKAQQPPPPPPVDPVAMEKVQVDKGKLQLETAKATHEAKDKDRRFMLDAAVAKHKAVHENVATDQDQRNAEADREQTQHNADADREQGDRGQVIDLHKERARASAKQAQGESGEAAGAPDLSAFDMSSESDKGLQMVAQAIADMTKALMAPKVIQRDASGRAVAAVPQMVN